MAKKRILRYHHIIHKVRENPSSYKEILDYLERQGEIQEHDFKISQRTLQRDLNDIREIYSIDIQHNSSTGKYVIIDEAQTESQARALEAFDLFNSLNLKEKLSEYIDFEKRRPLGTEHIYTVLSAAKKRRVLKFKYLKFGESVPTVREVEPYAIKESRFRWYIVGIDRGSGEIRAFGLERLSDLEVSNIRFKRPQPKFNVRKFFKDYYGINRYVQDGFDKETIEFTCNIRQAKYIKTLPIHSSQKVIKREPNKIHFELQVNITYDLIMELLSYGSDIEVLQPQSLRDLLKNRFESAAGLYK